MATFNKFLPTTVFDATFSGEGFSFTVDSLKIANFTQEGPEKTARGGKNNQIIARFGKTTRLEMEDALVNVQALQHLFGATIEGNGATINITDTFPGAVKIVGTTFVLDEDGEKVQATFTVDNFYPDGLLNLTMEAEGDFGVLEIGGEVIADNCGNFYTIAAGDWTPANCD